MTVTVSVVRAASSTTVSDAGGTYNGSAFATSAEATGVNLDDSNANDFTFDYFNTDTDTDLGSIAPVSAGDYIVTATYAGDSYHDGSSASTAFTIAKADASIVVTPYSATYDSNAHTATGSATGAGSDGMLGGLSFTQTTHTNVGSYTDTWTFTDVTGNYNDATGTVNDSIAPRDLYVTANGNSKTYGQTASETGSVNGVQGSDGITATFASAGDAADAPVGTGSYAIRATISDPNTELGNYTVHETDATLTVNPAAATVGVTPYSVIYGGSTHTATGTATGVFGEDLSADQDLSGTTHTNAGTTTDNWSFHDPNGNYADATSTVSDTIGQAVATITATDYSAPYDAQAHTAGVVITGVGGVVLAQNSATQTNAGLYTTSASISGLENYSDVSGTATIDIGKALATVAVTDYSATYDAQGARRQCGHQRRRRRVGQQLGYRDQCRVVLGQRRSERPRQLQQPHQRHSDH